MSEKGNERPDPGRSPRPTQAPRAMRTMSFWFLMVILLFIAFQLISSPKEREVRVNITQFVQELDRDNVAHVRFESTRIVGAFHEPVKVTERDKQVDAQRFYVNLPMDWPGLVDRVIARNSEAHPILIEAKEERFNWWGTLIAWAPILLLVFLWFFFIRQMQGGSNRAFSFGKSRAKLVGGDRPRTTFEDVAGADEAKVELNEIVEFLSDPKKFKRMGARIPRGALLVGPPGTGKTLLAKAVAGEARVPFYSMSGSDFVEMFVGVGASRVRDLFEQGKKNAPCILFVDELDAVGRQRGAGLGGGHDEREQTLNQLLVEMDGFDTSEGVILLAATNRPDVLDPALLRPGRFDRQIIVDMPDVRGREGILKVHMRHVPMADDVMVKALAQGTPGMSGADLANLVNEAALLAARKNHDKVYMIDFDEARDKIMIGPERSSMIPSAEKRRKTAYHEAGHAVVGAHFENADSIYKVTIVARGMASGVTHFLPKDEADQLWDREYFLERITIGLGGRVAEELVFGRISAGAAADIKSITTDARRMVTQWGMSEKLGPIAYGENEEMIFLGRSIQHHQNFSERTAQLIDDEVRSLVDECHERCRRIIESHRTELDAIAAALLERETISGDEVKMIMRGEVLLPFDKEAAEAGRKRRERDSLSTAERIEAVLAEARQNDGATRDAEATLEDEGGRRAPDRALDGDDGGRGDGSGGDRSGGDDGGREGKEAEDPFLGKDDPAEAKRKDRG